MTSREIYENGEDLVLTPELIDGFFESMMKNGRQGETIKVYRRSLMELYDFLPEDKVVSPARLTSWREQLEDKGYAPSTVNLWASAVNSLMRYCGYERARLHHTQLAPREAAPELTRSEYLQFLGKVREIGTEQEYLLIKVFASMDMTIKDLPHITAEAIRQGRVDLPGGDSEEIPECLKDELLHYTKVNRISSGPVFVTRSGNPLDRSNIAKSIRILAGKSGIPQDKCCPRSLHRMYQRTREDIWKGLVTMYDQAYDSLLTTEQTMIGWDAA